MAENSESIGALLATKVLEATRGFVARSVDPLAMRLASLETRLAALCLLRVDSTSASLLDRVSSLQARVSELETRLAELRAKD